jgi:hypothetical protein
VATAKKSAITSSEEKRKHSLRGAATEILGLNAKSAKLSYAADLIDLDLR